jgi:hypothetical protein
VPVQKIILKSILRKFAHDNICTKELKSLINIPSAAYGGTASPVVLGEVILKKSKK